MKYFISWIYIVFCVIGIYPVKAQKKVTGKVVDDSFTPVKDAKISVNGSQYVLTSASGEFVVALKTNNKPNVVKAAKDGLIIKDWNFKQGNLNVMMSEPKKIRGKVLSYKSVPVGNVQILLMGVRGLDAVKTDAQGNFSMVVPASLIINAQSPFIVFDPGRLKGTANYEIKLGEDGLIYLLVEVPPRAVRKVQVIDQNNEPVPDASVFIDNLFYTTNRQGEFHPSDKANDFSSYRASDLYIKNLEYIDKGNIMKIYVKKPVTEEEENQEAITAIDDQIDKKTESLVIERKSLVERLDILTGEIEKTKKRLESGESISQEERTRLEAKLRRLEAEFAQNSHALEVAQEKAEEAFIELQKTFSIEIEKSKDQLEKIKIQKEAAELKTKLSEQQYHLYLISSILVAVTLLSILATFFLKNKKINRHKNLLSEKNDMLLHSAKLMDQKNKEIGEKNKQLTEQNSKITSSIRYAQTIQNSILPSDTNIAEALPDSFIFYKPKDIVSGDFYWFSQREDEMILVAADCTGHGVPGAFMTMMGNTLLNQIVNEMRVTDPAEILTTLNVKVQSTLKQGNEHRDGDGMDMVVLNINQSQSRAVFAGAKNPLYCIQRDELIYIKGSNISIGSTLKNKNKKFENKHISLEGGETFYLVSDGFQDQLGMVKSDSSSDFKRRKYMKTNFMELMKTCSQHPLSVQKELFSKEFKDWKGKVDQTDDVLIMGVKIS